jgi:phosphoadenosine phosphosulfate reductase
VLIPSDRHRKEDLALWRDEYAADLVHGDSPRLARLVDQSERAVVEFMAAGPAYLGVSWGKDSVVVADLVWRVRDRLAHVPTLVWVKVDPIFNPDCPAVRDEFFRTRDLPYLEIPIDWGGGWKRPETGERTSADGFARARETLGTARHISGVRRDESRVREIITKKLGLVGERTARPIGWWRWGDVFGYLAANGLPTHPAYAMNGGGRWPREHLRVASLGGHRGTEFGRREWELEYYGDVIRRAEAL